MLAVNHQPNFVPQIHVKSQCLQRQKYLQPWMFLDTITPPQIWGSPSIMIFLSCLSTMVINYADINMDISTVNPEADFMGLAWAWDLYLVVPVSHSTIIMSKGFSNYCSDVEPHEPLLFSWKQGENTRHIYRFRSWEPGFLLQNERKIPQKHWFGRLTSLLAVSSGNENATLKKKVKHVDLCSKKSSKIIQNPHLYKGFVFGFGFAWFSGTLDFRESCRVPNNLNPWLDCCQHT